MAGKHHDPLRSVEFDCFIDLSRTSSDLVQAKTIIDSITTEWNTASDGPCSYAVAPHAQALSNGRGHCFVESPDRGVELLGRAIRDTAARGRALVVIRGAWHPSNEILRALAEATTYDPMVASAQGRFTPENSRGVFSPPGWTDSLLPFAALPSMLEITVTPEFGSALFVIASRALFSAPELHSVSLDQAWLELLSGLRRRGYRNILCNHIVSSFPLEQIAAYPRNASSPTDSRSGFDINDDGALAFRWLQCMREKKIETILAGAFSNDSIPRLLLDCRGMLPSHSGTSNAIIGFLEGFARLNLKYFDVVVLALDESARFHRLSTICSRFELQFDHPKGTFFAAILLNQPWSLNTVVELHNSSLILIVNMIDTIAWDTMYPAPDKLDNTWTVTAQIADGILFNSMYSLDRFRFRFQPDEDILLKTTYHSFQRENLEWDHTVDQSSDEKFLLLIGNEYDHKDLRPTLATLVRAFPFTKIVAIGIDSFDSPLVSTLQSGNLDGAQIHDLMRNAAALIFPSHYEGFGLPVVEALAHGTKVIVRESPLWGEIANLSRNSELIAAFRDESELVETVGQALHGVAWSGRHYVGAVSESELAWTDCSQAIVDLVEEISYRGNGRRWLNREALLNQSIVPREQLSLSSERLVGQSALGKLDDQNRSVLVESLDYLLAIVGLKRLLFSVSRKRRARYAEKRAVAKRLKNIISAS
jgi:glycosyltransferase involved in cell wall biosynthesis